MPNINFQISPETDEKLVEAVKKTNISKNDFMSIVTAMILESQEMTSLLLSKLPEKYIRK